MNKIIHNKIILVNLYREAAACELSYWSVEGGKMSMAARVEEY